MPGADSKVAKIENRHPGRPCGAGFDGWYVAAKTIDHDSQTPFKTRSIENDNLTSLYKRGWDAKWEHFKFNANNSRVYSIFV